MTDTQTAKLKCPTCGVEHNDIYDHSESACSMNAKRAELDKHIASIAKVNRCKKCLGQGELFSVYPNMDDKRAHWINCPKCNGSGQKVLTAIEKVEADLATAREELDKVRHRVIEANYCPKPRCRDCADADGTCPNSGELCDPFEQALVDIRQAAIARKELAKLRAALEMVAGIRQPANNLMGNVDIAKAALVGEDNAVGDAVKLPSWQDSVEWAEQQMEKLPTWLREALTTEEEARIAKCAARLDWEGKWKL